MSPKKIAAALRMLETNKVDEVELPKLPPVNQHVIVQCATFRCIGFVGEDGHWYRLASGKELSKVKGWIPLDGGELTPVG